MFNYITLICVGLGSIAFHGTLLREGQVLDEVPMLWTSLCKFYVAVTIRNRSNFTANLKLYGVILYGILATLVYFYVSFEMFVVAYTLTIVAIMIASFMKVL